MYRILDTIYNIIYLAYCRPTETDGAWDLQWESDGSQQTQHTVLPPSIPSRLWGILGTFFNFSEPLVRIAKPIPWYLQRDIHIENAGGWTTQDSPWRKVGKCEPRQTCSQHPLELCLPREPPEYHFHDHHHQQDDHDSCHYNDHHYDDHYGPHITLMPVSLRFASNHPQNRFCWFHSDSPCLLMIRIRIMIRFVWCMWLRRSLS